MGYCYYSNDADAMKDLAELPQVLAQVEARKKEDDQLGYMYPEPNHSQPVAVAENDAFQHYFG